ncbi:hypothetical protein [Parasphingopyxis sp.]|uniref:hypothetical protein n=1 Tax=Parasphingopyxis sp. TaxID=1920299 RepID=UPI00262956D6|nr:hypothetical protein [Parasphingopyxis sp.]
MIRRAAICATPLLLLACAGPEGEPPSLATRSIEGVLDEPVRGIAPVRSAADPALAAEIDRLVSQAGAGDRDFGAAYPAAERAVAAASGSSMQSETWIEAQLAVSALDSARAETIAALGDLDSMLAEQTASGRPAETNRLVAAREQVAALYESQNARYDALNRRLRTQ